MSENVAASKLETSRRDWNAAPIPELIDHIVGVHHAYMKREIPRITGLFDVVQVKYKKSHGDYIGKLIEQWSIVAQDMKQHTFKEESVLFPMIREMAEQSERGEEVVCTSCSGVEAHIQQMELEHDDVLEVFSKFSDATGAFSASDDVGDDFAELYSSLKAMSENLVVHIGLENNFLHKRAVKLEEKL